MTIKANIQALQEAEQALRSHCMCARIRDDGVCIEIEYPAGDWPGGIAGVCANYGVHMGKTEAIGKLLARMEKDWLDSYPGASKN